MPESSATPQRQPQVSHMKRNFLCFRTRQNVALETAMISAGERQGRSPAEILGSNPTGGMDICLL